jgi:hypothetical protein
MHQLAFGKSIASLPENERTIAGCGQGDLESFSDSEIGSETHMTARRRAAM